MCRQCRAVKGASGSSTTAAAVRGGKVTWERRQCRAVKGASGSRTFSTRFTTSMQRLKIASLSLSMLSRRRWPIDDVLIDDADEGVMGFVTGEVREHLAQFLHRDRVTDMAPTVAALREFLRDDDESEFVGQPEPLPQAHRHAAHGARHEVSVCRTRRF